MGDLIVRLLDGLRAAVVAIVTAVTSAGADLPPTAQGYVEGEFVRVAAPASGRLERLLVARGDQVQRGDLLFALDATAELAARDQAVADLRAAEARLADLRKGKRQPEVEVIAAQKAQAEAMRDLSAVQLRRQEQLARTAAASMEQLDSTRANYRARRRACKRTYGPARGGPHGRADRRDRRRRGGGGGGKSGARPS